MAVSVTRGLGSETTATNTEPSPARSPASPPLAGLPRPILPAPPPTYLAQERERSPDPISLGANCGAFPFNIAGEAAEINGKLEFCWGLRDQPGAALHWGCSSPGEGMAV